MGKGERVKRDDILRDLCAHEDCGLYMHWLEERVAELEFQLGLREKIEDPFEIRPEIHTEYDKQRSEGK